ncbi:hypothetical protein HYPSUDRAFT_873593 [Hypholoma sublateritium FD-334 SS-4]|uniref:SNF2 N-terminal domain-containing protein n=1 Tax=Hypholoma sublateritium (strain FD-334 SS-4) TaxID=945553 RepID=A0A0D2PGX9_HYPSF|nr:hypothetical protein HYPSUDRAFT_873593 [Hypholoma sublateritium FD-334 SS-4]
MARCHRDGQKRPVFIYRLLTAGAIDEKIYQRQVTKLALSDSLIGSGSTSSKSDSFTRKDLRDIFRIHPDAACNTHDLLECPCDSAIPMDDDDSDLVLTVDDDKMPEMGFVCASDVPTVDPDVAEKAYLQKKKTALASLSEWKHINCLKSSAADLVQDDILRRLLINSVNKSESSESEATRSSANTLLAGIDLNRIQAMDQVPSPRDFPGGTISFLFEKYSKTNLNPDDSI